MKSEPRPPRVSPSSHRQNLERLGGQFVAAAAEAAPFTMLAPLMMPLCLTLTNGMVHHAALLRPNARLAPMPPRMFDRGKSTGGVKGRSNQAGGSSKSAISGDSPFSPAVSQVPAANSASLRCIRHQCVPITPPVAD